MLHVLYGNKKLFLLMERGAFIIHGAFFVVILGLSITGIVVDEILRSPKHDISLACSDARCELKISGIRVSSSKFVLEYNKCQDDPPRVEYSGLYSLDGVPHKLLSDGASRDSSIVEFAHVNIQEEGTEIIGEIGVTGNRANVARQLSYFAVCLQGLALVLFLALRREPMSIISKPDGDDETKFHLFQQLMNWLGIVGATILWLSVIFYSTLVPNLLSHLFREGRDRCSVEFTSVQGEHTEMRAMGTYVRDHSNPNGSSIILFSMCAAISLIHSMYLFNKSNMKPLTYLQLTPSQVKSLPWYCRVWSWKFTIVVAVFGILLSFWVMNLTKVRGFSINNFYWAYGSKVAQKTGLSRTGTLLDFAQKVLSLIAVPEAIMSASTYMWLFTVPVLALACSRPVSLLLKGIQDFAVIFIMRSVIAWVTIAPTTLSMLEKPECFVEPEANTSRWSWFLVYDLKQSCNDTMFSVTFAVVGMHAIMLMYYVMYGGVLKGSIAGFVCSFIALAGIAVCIVAVVSRHQYSSDVVIGASIVICYMLTQIMAYQLLFEGDSVDIMHPGKLLSEKVTSTLEECVIRLRGYLRASKELRGLKSSSNDFAEMALLYRSVGQAISEAKTGRPAIQAGLIPAPVEHGTDS